VPSAAAGEADDEFEIGPDLRDARAFQPSTVTHLVDPTASRPGCPDHDTEGTST